MDGIPKMFPAELAAWTRTKSPSARMPRNGRLPRTPMLSRRTCAGAGRGRMTARTLRRARRRARGSSPRPAGASVASRVRSGRVGTRRIEGGHREAERGEPEAEPEDPVPEEHPADRGVAAFSSATVQYFRAAAERRHTEWIEQLSDPRVLEVGRRQAGGRAAAKNATTPK
jgi:hypothetical protein